MAPVDRTRLEDQLADELFTRVEALHGLQIVTSSSEHAETQRRVRTRAAGWAAAADDGDWSRVGDEVLAVLFPSGVPAAHAEWWRTPLGDLLGGSAPPADGDR